MHCSYFDAGSCRSCTQLEVAYPEQVGGKERLVRDLLGDAVTWSPAVTGPESGFRNKAKMVVAGTLGAPTLGILDPLGTGVDLRGCGLHEPLLHDALPELADFVVRARLTPYDVPARRGELKHLIVTASPDGELMVRFVLRSQEPVARIRKHLPELMQALPVRVASVNLQPEHKAVLEGDVEIVLTESASLPMRMGAVTLQLRPQSFFQTNSAIAERLYDTARSWVDAIAPRSVWDLYSGVGGFALHAAGAGRRVTGVEVSEEAVRSATATARLAGVEADFVAADATAWATRQVAGSEPDLVVVNPPRRGIGAELATWLERSAVGHVLYSSCRATTLARDLEQMPSLHPRRATLFDMFPQTEHAEVLVLLERTTPA